MMKAQYVFVPELYYQTFKSQIGGSIPVFHGARQRGGGIGSILGGIAKYALPILSRFIFPHAKQAAIRTLSDLEGGRSVKDSVKSNSVKFLKEVGSDFIKSRQSEKGIITRKRKNQVPLSKIPIVKSKKRKPSRKRKPKAKKPKKRTKRDIFE